MRKSDVFAHCHELTVTKMHSDWLIDALLKNVIALGNRGRFYLRVCRQHILTFSNGLPGGVVRYHTEILSRKEYACAVDSPLHDFSFIGLCEFHQRILMHCSKRVLDTGVKIHVLAHVCFVWVGFVCVLFVGWTHGASAMRR